MRRALRDSRLLPSNLFCQTVKVIGPLRRNIEDCFPVVRERTVLVIAEPPFDRHVFASLQLAEELLRDSRLGILLRLHSVTACVFFFLYSRIAQSALLRCTSSFAGVGRRGQQGSKISLEELHTLTSSVRIRLQSEYKGSCHHQRLRQRILT